MSLHKRIPTIWALTRFDTNWPVQWQNNARDLKFRSLEGERLYNLCSKNKGADQLCSYCTADLCLCFCLSMLLVFTCSGSYSMAENSVADLEGVRGVRSNPPLGPNYFKLMGKLKKIQVKCRKRTPFLGLNPPSRNPGSAPEIHFDDSCMIDKIR